MFSHCSMSWLDCSAWFQPVSFLWLHAARSSVGINGLRGSHLNIWSVIWIARMIVMADFFLQWIFHSRYLHRVVAIGSKTTRTGLAGSTEAEAQKPAQTLRLHTVGQSQPLGEPKCKERERHSTFWWCEQNHIANRPADGSSFQTKKSEGDFQGTDSTYHHPLLTNTGGIVNIEVLLTFIINLLGRVTSWNTIIG